MWGEEQADSYLASLFSTFDLLGKQPLLGREVSHIREGYRKYPCGSHLVFYRIERSRVEVIRVLHSRMVPEGRL